MNNLKTLRDQGHWCEVRLVTFASTVLSVQLLYALEGGAASALCAELAYDKLDTLPELLDGMAAKVIEKKAKG